MSVNLTLKFVYLVAGCYRDAYICLTLNLLTCLIHFYQLLCDKRNQGKYSFKNVAPLTQILTHGFSLVVILRETATEIDEIKSFLTGKFGT